MKHRAVAMVGAHWCVRVEDVAGYLGIGSAAFDLVDRLCTVGLLRRERFTFVDEPLIRVTAAGLREIGSRLEPPGALPSDVVRELVAVRLWTIISRGRVAPDARRVLSRRELVAVDRAAERSVGEGSGFRLERDGREAFPDVGVVTSTGHRLGLEVALWPFRSPNPETLLDAYAEPSSARGVVFVNRKAKRCGLEAAVRERGLEGRVWVRHLASGSTHIEPVMPLRR